MSPLHISFLCRSSLASYEKGEGQAKVVAATFASSENFAVEDGEIMDEREI